MGLAPRRTPTCIWGSVVQVPPSSFRVGFPERAHLSPSQTLKTHTDNWECRTKAFLLGTRLESCQTPLYLRLNVDKAWALLRVVIHAVWKTNTSLPSSLRPVWQMTPNITPVLSLLSWILSVSAPLLGYKTVGVRMSSTKAIRTPGHLFFCRLLIHWVMEISLFSIL